MEIRKGLYRIIKLIFTIAILLPIIMLARAEILVKIEIRNTKEILSNIDADEFQEEIIERLEDSIINIDKKSTKTTFEVFQDVDSDIMDMCTYASKNDIAEDYVCAFIVDSREETGMLIPLFKIESDKNGKFKKIEYCSVSYWFKDNFLEKSINDVLESEYGLKRGMAYYGGYKYSQAFYGPMHKPSKIGIHQSLRYKDKDFATEILEDLNDYDIDNEYYYKSLLNSDAITVIWGLLD